MRRARSAVARRNRRLARQLRPPLTRPRALDRRPHRPRRRLPVRRPHALHARRHASSRRSPSAGTSPPTASRYTFHLRRDVTFHDGSPFTARNVVASWERALDPGDEERRGAVPLSDHRRARVQRRDGEIDRRTRRAERHHARRHARRAARDLHQDARDARRLGRPAEHPGELRRAPDRHRPVEARRVEARRLSCSSRRIRAYFGGAPKTDTLRARIIAEPSTAVAEFESGNVDVLQIPATEARDWVEDESRKPMLMSTPALELVYIGINTTRGPLTDVRVRQAINYAIDVEPDHRAPDQRPRHPRRRRDSAHARRIRQHAQRRIPTTRRRRSQLLAAAGPPERNRHRALDLHQPDLPSDRRNGPGVPRTPSAFAPRSCSASPPRRAPRRARARRT